MQELIRFYLLEQPRSVSDMIEDLTEKELSSDAGERSDEIPRIAGNWFREGSGYLWKLRDRGIIQDRGRQYALDREKLVEDLLADLQVHRCFPEREVRGDDSPPTDAYSYIIPDTTLGDLKERLRKEVFSASPMKELFEFRSWEDALLEDDQDPNRVASHRLRIGFWPSVHLVLLSSVLASRQRHITELRRDETDHYFRWRRRQERIEDSTSSLRDAIVRACFPGEEKGEDGSFSTEEGRAVSEGFMNGVDTLEPDAAELVANLYLLSFNDGVELFNQYSHYDHDINLLFNLMERGWMVNERNVERDDRTGNIVIPLGEARSYIHDLSSLFVREPS